MGLRLRLKGNRLKGNIDGDEVVVLHADAVAFIDALEAATDPASAGGLEVTRAEALKLATLAGKFAWALVAALVG